MQAPGFIGLIALLLTVASMALVFWMYLAPGVGVGTVPSTADHEALQKAQTSVEQIRVNNTAQPSQ